MCKKTKEQRFSDKSAAAELFRRHYVQIVTDIYFVRNRKMKLLSLTLIN